MTKRAHKSLFARLPDATASLSLPVLCCVMRTVSAEVTQPLHARQSSKETLAVCVFEARIRSGLTTSSTACWCST